MSYRLTLLNADGSVFLDEFTSQRPYGTHHVCRERGEDGSMRWREFPLLSINMAGHYTYKAREGK